MSERDNGSDRRLADVPEEGEAEEPQRVSTRAWVGRFLGPALALAAYLLIPAGGGLSQAGLATISVGLLMATWWVTEALPLAATALLPIVLFPLFGVVEVGDATAPYASDTIFLFMGGFMIALAMQRWGLHRRIALKIVMAVGTQPVRLIGGFMLATGLISMWVSNTATAVMMLPIGLSVLTLTMGDGSDASTTGEGEQEGERRSVASMVGSSNFAVCLMLGIAYAASVGSLATIIGTPPNTFMVEFLDQQYGVEIGFGQWMMVGLPLAAVFLVVVWVVLTRFVYPPEISEISGGRELIGGQLEGMGPASRGEKIVFAVFVVTALLWVLRQPLAALPLLGGLEDAGIAIAAAIALFAIPVDWRNGVFALDWRTASNIPWGVLLLFGGGLSLANGISETGVDAWIGDGFSGLTGLPTLLFIVLVTGTVVLLTEFTSNTATAAALLPIFGGVAVGLNLDPMLFVIPAALAASCAFMLPVATPPNAIVFGSGYVTIGQMVKAGIWLNVIALILITATMYALAGWVLGISFG